jgi:hypothetical protein
MDERENKVHIYGLPTTVLYVVSTHQSMYLRTTRIATTRVPVRTVMNMVDFSNESASDNKLKNAIKIYQGLQCW